MRTPKPDEEKEPKKTILVRVPEPWHDDLRDRAHKERRHISDLVREALCEKFGFPSDEPEKGRKGGQVFA